MKNKAGNFQKNNKILMPLSLNIDSIISSYKQYAYMFKLQI